MTALSAGPDGVFPIGRVREVSDDAGKELVRGGYAVEVTEKVVTPQQPSIEEFIDLSASEQKSLLAELEIEGDASNEEKRVDLYAAYLEQ